MNLSVNDRDAAWPALPFEEWQATAETLHMWTQIVGKIRLKLTPWVNHSWHVTLYLTSRGLTTSPIRHGLYTFELRFDFLDHHLRILKSDGRQHLIKLRARPVAEFYRAVMGGLSELELPVKIDLLPNEISNPIAFDRDETHRAYDPEYANRFWRVLVQSDRLFKNFRARFCGKCSPVHFFWGSFDLAVTRFSGRPAPPHPGGVPHLPDAVAREAYAQEVSSVGFWPGSAASPTPIYYSYAYPEPPGYPQTQVRPNEASYLAQLHEFTLPYDVVRSAASPDDALLDFAQSTYDAASWLGKWDRDALDEAQLHPPHP
ncbi:MAG: hypothetical protein H0X34_01595 [Chthoniobacterales bacterium]|nr:hypothetical protein [Chthoniobacterales bacterium]